MNDLYKFVNIIKEHEEVKEGFESMELATGATLQPLRTKISEALNYLYDLQNLAMNENVSSIVLDKLGAIIALLEEE